MMILVDTSSWIEWLIDSPTGEKVAQHLPEQAVAGADDGCSWNWRKWLAREVGEDKADQVIAFTQVCQVVPLDTEIALAAAEACRSTDWRPQMPSFSLRPAPAVPRS